MTDLVKPDFTDATISDASHRAFLRQDAARQIDFFRQSLRPDGGFDSLDLDGSAISGAPQELHATTRMVHSFALGKLWGADDCDAVIDAGMAFLWSRHRDTVHGGYVWALDDAGVSDDQKLAYGHVFVLLAGASAKLAGHPDADRLIADVSDVLDRHFWEEGAGLFCDEFSRDWTPFSTYRGFNANMHGVEALLAAYEATGERGYLDRAGRILEFFTARIAPAYSFRLPEHYTPDWQPDFDYAGNPMFRPRGTTPGHSFEMGRLLIQWWDQMGRPEDHSLANARALIETALSDAWLPGGGFAYTLDYDGQVQVADRYWWPLTEAIGAVATLLKVDPQPSDLIWYRTLWAAASDLFIDHDRGGWFPEVDAEGRPTARQFHGKPDIYHALQADLMPLAPGVSLSSLAHS